MTLPSHVDGMRAGRYLRVLNYHNTPASAAAALRRELTGYAKAFRCVTVDDLDEWYETGRWPDDRPGFVPVFYEGYRNGLDVAAPVLEELGLVGWFPICTGFLDCPPEEQEVFARSHWLGIVPEELNSDRLAMTWSELGELAGRHVVVAHTASHAGIADVVTDADLEREVVAPRRRIEEATGRAPDVFAWLWGTRWGAAPRHDAALLDAGYRYLVSNTMLHRIG